VSSNLHKLISPGIALVVLAQLFSHWGMAAVGFKLSSARLEIGVSSLYDNNILRYSDRYISRFNNREDAGRFHISTLDDLILVNSLRLSATMRLIGSLNTTAAVDFRQRRYIINSIKNWTYYAFSLRQDLSKELAAQIGYNYIPAFYIRHFRDEDWTALYGFRNPIVYRPFAYTKDEVGGWLQYTLFPTTRVRVNVTYARYFHNKHFTEYDCSNTEIGFALYKTIWDDLNLSVGFGLVYSRGDGTIDMNPSYDQNSYSLDVEYRLPNIFHRSNTISIGGQYAYRGFITKHFLELDPNHAGREDFIYEINATYTVDVLANLTLGLAYAWRYRDTETSAVQNADYLSAEKDYRQHQIGLDMKYTLKLK